jgi:hypothetical protein
MGLGQPAPDDTGPGPQPGDATAPASTGPTSTGPAVTGPPPAAEDQVADLRMTGDPEALTAALRAALTDVRVEVDLGAIESVVTDSLRTALAELPPGALAPLALPAGALPPDDAAPAGDAGASTQVWSGPPEVGSEPGPLLADVLRDEIVDIVRSTLAEAVDAFRAAPVLAAASALPDPAEPDPAHAPVAASARADVSPVLHGGSDPEVLATVAASAGLDPVDVARRVAASVLSPREIASSLVQRLLPLLEDQAQAAARKVAAEAAHDRAALLRAVERIDRRLERLEREVARPSLPEALR